MGISWFATAITIGQCQALVAQTLTTAVTQRIRSLLGRPGVVRARFAFSWSPHFVIVVACSKQQRALIVKSDLVKRPSQEQQIMPLLQTVMPRKSNPSSWPVRQKLQSCSSSRLTSWAQLHLGVVQAKAWRGQAVLRAVGGGAISERVKSGHAISALRAAGQRATRRQQKAGHKASAASSTRGTCTA